MILDSCARLHLDAGERVGSYFGCGVMGVICGAALIVLLVSDSATPVTPQAALISVVAPQIAFLLAVKASQIIAGYERIVMYEMTLAALAGTAGALAVAGEPLGSGIDLAAVGIMTFLSVGRIGCLRVGCCHGRPSRYGIVYGPAHAAAGLPRYLVGVRLFPIQLVEAGAAAAIAGAAALRILRPHIPYEAAALTLTLYGLSRFILELGRGDAVRPRWLGLSEAQWTAVVLSWLLALGAWRLAFPNVSAYLVAAAVLSWLSVALVTIQRKWPHGAHAAAQPFRLAELSQALDLLSSAPDGGMSVVTTEHGLCVSGTPRGAHLTISAPGLEARGARLVAWQITVLLKRAQPEVRPGQVRNVFHLIFPP